MAGEPDLTEFEDTDRVEALRAANGRLQRQLREAIEDPVLHAKLYKTFGKKPCKGIALHGPAGCGKTMLARAAATALAKVHGKKAAPSGFQYVKGPELLHGIVGSSEGNVRALFAASRNHFAEHGYPALIFLDEADGLLTARGRTPWEGMERTVVPMFLAEMDGLEGTGATVLLATNRPDTIDPAFMRDGRIDRKIEIRRPNEAECADIFAKCLKGKPAQLGIPELAARELFDGRHFLRTREVPADGLVASPYGGNQTTRRERVPLSSMVSGAMVAGIVDRAAQRALRFAIAHPKVPPCLSMENIREAIEDVVKEEVALGGGA